MVTCSGQSSFISSCEANTPTPSSVSSMFPIPSTSSLFMRGILVLWDGRARTWGRVGRTFLKAPIKGASGFSLPSPNPIPPSPKTFVFIESLFRKVYGSIGIGALPGVKVRFGRRYPLHFLSRRRLSSSLFRKESQHEKAPSLGDEAHWGTASVRPFVPDSAGTCRRIKKSWEKGRGLGEGRKPLAPFMGGLPERLLPSPKENPPPTASLHRHTTRWPAQGAWWRGWRGRADP